MTKAKEGKLVSSIPKAVAHLRAQHHRKRLGLVFGAGISIDLKFPNWDGLVERISLSPEVNAQSVLNKLKKHGPAAKPVMRSLASITQLLFSKFRDREIKTLGKKHLTYVEEQKIKTAWLRLIHRELYRDLSREERDVLMKGHPYLNGFLDIIKESPLTVTYNFDDTLERMLTLARSEDEEERTRGFEAVDAPNSQFRRENSVIYHPSGYLPAVFENGASADVVFSDESFQDQLIRAASGQYTHLSSHLFRNTCLLIGLSLDDNTLQSLLRQNAVSNPGNIHYFVHYTQSGDDLNDEVKSAVFNANFESFALYTLFLNGEEIDTLASLIKMEKEAFDSRHARHKPKFVYYLIGSVGAGKSTAAKNFRNLITYDEWIDERKPDLARPETEVDADHVPGINEWISEQFRKKNIALQERKEGIHIIDRAPLDPLTFGRKADRMDKARALLARITEDDFRKVEPGHIIELEADVQELQIRNSGKHKYWPNEEFDRLLGAIAEVYGDISRTVVCTKGRDATMVAREIARIIFAQDYIPVDVGAALSEHAKGHEDA